MIVLDTHIWYWWVHTPERLSQSQMEALNSNSQDVIGVSAMKQWHSPNARYAAATSQNRLHPFLGVIQFCCAFLDPLLKYFSMLSQTGKQHDILDHRS